MIFDEIVTGARELGFNQIAMDSTFGTNNEGHELYAVLAAVNGTGVPLAYCVVTKGNKEHGSEGATMTILCKFLSKLKEFGVNPLIVNIDKDEGEINAVSHCFPETRIQLCFWHMHRAISMHVSSKKETNGLSRYSPADAASIIPYLDICWASLPHRRPLNHRDGSCSCLSKYTPPPVDKGRIESMSAAEVTELLEIAARHFNRHPFFPDSIGIKRTPDEIYTTSASEAYDWCKGKGYPRLWAYLWTNWYSPSKWKLWARSFMPHHIPALRTTMIVESHWRTIKHVYLHTLNQARIDTVVHVILAQVSSCAIIIAKYQLTF